MSKLKKHIWKLKQTTLCSLDFIAALKEAIEQRDNSTIDDETILECLGVQPKIPKTYGHKFHKGKSNENKTQRTR